ncbi:MAG: hypothetical protein HY666_00065 [Chloroflexi bacterium]|nr:hypothetical protein [Chloroflexota bacterium]
MTEQTSPKRRRGPKTFPTVKFEDVLVLAKGIQEHGAGDRMRRLTLFDELERSPESSTSRNLVTISARYGLTSGGYAAEYLALTDDAKIVLGDTHPEEERRQKSFQMAIGKQEVLQNLYDRLKNKRLPAPAVLKDELAELSVSEADRSLAAEVFVANARFLGLVREVSGAERLLPIEQVLEELSGAPKQIVPAEPKPETPPVTQTPPGVMVTEPSVHIDIQIHIDSSASAEQIDQIFASMARHLYRR